MDPFANLPEGCVADIISFTSPMDAIRSSAVSKAFKSAADSDSIWEHFLPSDHQDIISRSVSLVDYSTTKKELYFSLCESHLLLDGGKMAFSLDKRSGKKCFMVGPRKLVIAWADNSWCWIRTTDLDSRFADVIRLHNVCWLDVRGRIETKMLSRGTNYAAFLVFKLAEKSTGLQFANVLIRLVNHETDAEAENRATMIHLQPEKFKPRAGELVGKVPQKRDDGWMEIEMGTFYNDQGDDGEVEARVNEIKSRHGKSGLIVEGIEFRPKCA